MKKVMVFGVLLLAGLSARAEEAIFLKVKPGESIEAFNKSGISPTKIKTQNLQKAVTSVEVQYLPTSVQSQFFTLNSKNWKCGLVEYQNNILKKIVFSNEKVKGTQAGELFNELEKSFGPDFSIYPFKSFGDQGITFQWIDNKKVYEFSVSENKHHKWSYVLEVKSENDKNSSRSKLDISSPEVVAVMNPLMGNESEKPVAASAR